MQNYAAIGAAYGLTAIQVQNVINRAIGYETLTMGERYELLDKNLNTLGVNSDISKFVPVPGQIQDTLSNAVHRTMSMQYMENRLLDFNTRQHYVRNYYQWYNVPPSLGGEPILEVPVGIFTNTLPDRSISGMASRAVQVTGNTWKIQLTDLMGKFAKLKFLDAYTVTAGTNVIQAVIRGLTQDKMPLGFGGSGSTPAGGDYAGFGLPLQRLNITPSSLTLPSDSQAQPGDYAISFFNSLLASINFYELMMTVAGVIWTKPIPAYAGQNPGILWQYPTDTSSTFKPDSIEQSFPDADPHNIIKVISNNNVTGSISSEVANRSPNSSVSLIYEDPYPDVIEDDDIPDQETCDLRAVVELQKAATIGDQIAGVTAINPFFEPHDTVGLNIAGQDGTVFVATGAFPWEVQSLTWDMSTFEQAIVVGKVVAL